MVSQADAVTFAERTVEAEGFTIRYLEAGDGPPLVCFHGAGGLRISRGHELLAREFRVIAFEAPGFGTSRPNTRSASLRDLAGTMRRAVVALGVARSSVWGTSFGGKLALWYAIDDPTALEALVLESSAAIRLERSRPPTPDELPRLQFAHPERHLPIPPLDPAVAARQQELAMRLIGPARDPELESAMGALDVPTLVLFGDEDPATPPELGRHYRELLPNCHFVIVHDAAHAIAGDRPEAFAATVGDFLRRREQFVVRETSGLLYP